MTAQISGSAVRVTYATDLGIGSKRSKRSKRSEARKPPRPRVGQAPQLGRRIWAPLPCKFVLRFLRDAR
jgi:hypothetical protein